MSVVEGGVWSKNVGEEGGVSRADKVGRRRRKRRRRIEEWGEVGEETLS